MKDFDDYCFERCIWYLGVMPKVDEEWAIAMELINSFSMD